MSVNQRLTSSQSGKNIRPSLDYNQVSNRPVTLPYLPQLKHISQPSVLKAPAHYLYSIKKSNNKIKSKTKKRTTKKRT